MFAATGKVFSQIAFVAVLAAGAVAASAADALPKPPQILDHIVVTATRAPQPPEQVAATATLFGREDVRLAPAITLDSLLRSDPAFSLFRRSDSLVANPTTQGVSLRGLGPSGASRSLVLLDGVPLNDPFGGWVTWTKLPREAITRVEVVPGGGAAAWGNGALGGVIQIVTPPVQASAVPVAGTNSRTTRADVGNGQASVRVGDFGTRGAEVVANQPTQLATVQLLANDFSTEGYSVIAPERRGPVDVPAWTRHRSLTLRSRSAFAQNAEFVITGRSYEEFRGNGTPYQHNGTREKFASLEITDEPVAQFAWKAVAYAQDQSFASTFSSINATRTAETPASDQFAVPAVALGGAWTGTWQHDAGATTTAGIDARAVHGETRENYMYVNGAFTRQRVAGGTQREAGIFALHDRALGHGWHFTAGARVDRWFELNGHRLESDRATGVASRDDHYPSRAGTEFSPSLGLVWKPSPAWRWHANVQQASRRPTLNELYRPFRQGPNVTEANPGLDTEHDTSAEVGVAWTFGRTRAIENHATEPTSVVTTLDPTLTLSATGFWNDLRNAVSNVTIAHGPGTFPVVGFVAAGGTGRQRLNLDRTRVQGVELSAQWRPARTLAVVASYLYDDATVRRASIAPTLVGKRLAEVPRHTGTVTGNWKAPFAFTLSPRVRWIGRQYDDDENTIELAPAVVVDLGITRPIGNALELFLDVENVGNTRIETARNSDGIVSTGTPRFASGGIRARW